MFNKPLPYLFLFFLVVILVFIIGIRYGQRVEKTNKTINYILSLTPTKSTTSPTMVQYKKYVNSTCGIEFIYPSNLAKKESTVSALFTQAGQAELEIDCFTQSQLLEILKDEDIATAEIEFQSKKIESKVTNNNQVYVFSVIHPKTKKRLNIAIKKYLYPLFERTVEF